MGFFTALYDLIVEPLCLLFDVVYAYMLRFTTNEGVAIIALSLVINILILPLYRRADAMQEEERIRTRELQPGVDHIKKVFKGDERFMMLQTYYRQNHYKPYYALKGSLSLLLQVPFFIAAYNYLSGSSRLSGASFGPIDNLCLPDGLIHIAGHSLNLLPLLMTAINLVSSVIYTKGMPLKSKLQPFGLALIFLVLLYDSPSGLVFYWTLNNLFSLFKNVFYKIPRPKFVLCVISAAVPTVALPYVLFIKPFDTSRKQLFAVVALLLMLLPLACHYLMKKHKPSISVPQAAKTDNVIFYASCVFVAILTGLLIPSAVIRSSPDEFVDIYNPQSPLRYVLHSFLLAAGTFTVWMNIFYRLSTASIRKILSVGSAVFAFSAIVNYMFFGNDYGNMTSELTYDNVFINTGLQIALNLGVLFVLAAMIAVICVKRPAIVKTVCAAGCVAVLVMSCANVFHINSRYASLRKELSANGATQSDTSGSGENTARLTLDKTGKNVVVIMLDRAINSYFPFIMQELPELREQFEGFTYYPNTISYGNYTNVGTPGIYGGYEYIPEENNKRSDKTLGEKQNEALRIMPVLFSQNGYETTVCDPTYAGYQWIPDLSIYNDYPEIKKYITNGSFFSPDSLEKIQRNTNNLRTRNFFAYGVFRSSPLLLHQTLYNSGYYNQADLALDTSVQLIRNNYQAIGDGLVGANLKFYEAYDALRNYPTITEVRDSGQGTFTMISNDTTHYPIMLQEPAYEPAQEIDNRSYEAEHSVRVSMSGDKMPLCEINQIIHYQTNAAALVQLGKWFDYLRKNGVYDNTKIIIVSDHGAYIPYPERKFDDEHAAGYSIFNDVKLFQSLLLVKDFDSRELTTDDTFMTNADTPALAFSGVIDDPINPFTGKKISTDYKDKSEQHIAYTNSWSTTSNNGNTFKDIVWVGLKGSRSDDIASWRIIGDTLE